jgi:hypothetical protein
MLILTNNTSICEAFEFIQQKHKVLITDNAATSLQEEFQISIHQLRPQNFQHV